MAMTKSERDDLARLIRQRERVQKGMASQRSAVLIAEFETQLATKYSFDQDATWKAAKEAAEAAVEDARKKIAARCRELGIPSWAAPDLALNWYSRGENALRERRDELRRAAKSQIAALEETAKVQIEQAAVAAQTELLASGLTSDAAKVFLEKMPSVDALMQPLSLGSIEQQLVNRRRGNAYEGLLADDSETAGSA